MSEVPQRIGDAERDQAVQELQAHHAAGRIDLSEFDERMQRALEAKTMNDLTPLFVDLPGASFRQSPLHGLAVPGNPLHGLAVQGSPAPGGQSGPVQGGGLAPQPSTPVLTTRPSGAQRTFNLLMALMWPTAVIINLAFGWEWWWLFLVPVFFGGPIARSLGLETRRDRRKLETNDDRKEIE